MKIFKKKRNFLPLSTYPAHVAIIMDGNGRWANRRGMPRNYGHLKGAENLKKICLACHELNIKVLTVYAFSTENWSRPKEEVDHLFNLLEKFFNEFLGTIIEKGLKVIVSGFYQELPNKLVEVIDNTINKTKDLREGILNICLNYGSNQEILMSTKKIASDVKNNRLDINSITQETIIQNLFTANLPPLDILIRTGGDCRLSNFLLYQAAYSELFFVDTLWPDFDKTNLYEILQKFAKRQRRYGGLK